MNTIMLLLVVLTIPKINLQTFNIVKDCNHLKCITKVLDKETLVSQIAHDNGITEYIWADPKTYYTITVLIKPDGTVKEIRYTTPKYQSRIIKDLRSDNDY